MSTEEQNEKITLRPCELDKQLAFAEAYIASNRNATKAYREVYGDRLSDEVAAAAASRLLRNVKIRHYIKQKFDALQLDAHYVMSGLKDLAENAEREGTRLKAFVEIGKALGIYKKDYIEQKTQTEKETPPHVKKFIERILDIQKENKEKREKESHFS